MDTPSERASAALVRAGFEPLLDRDTVSIVALDISDGSTDFKSVFASMGIPDNLVLTNRSRFVLDSESLQCCFARYRGGESGC